MCIIAVSGAGIRQPSDEEITKMFVNNPDGAGYMVVRNGEVEIHKGFMYLEDFLEQIHFEKFTPDDVVVYHFRISTQGGVNPQMCHPFPLSKNLSDMNVLDCVCDVGVAHNGVIPMTTDRSDKEYSDTARFITKYLPYLVRKQSDITDNNVKSIIGELINSKMVLVSKKGDVSVIGNFTEQDGILFSNSSFKEARYRFKKDKQGYFVLA